MGSAKDVIGVYLCIMDVCLFSRRWLLYIGAVFGVCALLASTVHIFRHVLYNESVIRRCTVRILAMVPFYSIDAFLCLTVEEQWHPIVPVLTCCRDAYEAVALLSFMQFILTVKGGPRRLAMLLEEQSPEPVHHLPPLGWVWKRSYKQGKDFMGHMLRGVLQYAAVMLLVLIGNLLVWGFSQVANVPHDADVSEYIIKCFQGVKIISCGWALYCLVLFGHAAAPVFPRKRFALKFLAIKGLVFFTFWQEWAIAFLDKIGFLRPLEILLIGEADTDSAGFGLIELKSSFNDLLLCFECLLFAVLHWFAYLPHEWRGFRGLGFDDDNENGGTRVLTPTQPIARPDQAAMAHVVEIWTMYRQTFAMLQEASSDQQEHLLAGSH